MAIIDNLTATWTSGGTTFSALKMNVTDSASAAASMLLNLLVGSTEKFAVTKAGDVRVNTDKFTVAGASGNTAIAGTAAITGDVAINTDKFTVAASSGNTAIAGTLAVTGASTLTGALAVASSVKSSHATAGIGYATGAGAAATQGTSRTTTVVCNAASGAITLFSAAGSATPFSFTVTCSAVAATDVIHLSQKSGTDKYILLVTAVGAGSFQVTAYTTGGTTTEQPVFNFAVIKAVAA